MFFNLKMLIIKLNEIWYVCIFIFFRGDMVLRGFKCCYFFVYKGFFIDDKNCLVLDREKFVSGCYKERYGLLSGFIIVVVVLLFYGLLNCKCNKIYMGLCLVIKVKVLNFSCFCFFSFCWFCRSIIYWYFKGLSEGDIIFKE